MPGRFREGTPETIEVISFLFHENLILINALTSGPLTGWEALKMKPKLAYLFSTYPDLTTTFMQHQVMETERQGLKVVLAANTTPPLSRVHPEDRPLMDRTTYLTPPKIGRYVSANLKALITDPGRYFKALRLALKLNDKYRFQRLKNIFQVFGAAVLADEFKRAGVVHVHVHFAFGAASMAFFLKELSGLPYSLTIHGSDALMERPLTFEKLRRASFVVTNCVFHVNFLRPRFVELFKTPFYLVRGGLDLKSGPWSEFTPAEIDGPLRLLHVGRLSEEKNQARMIRGLGLLKEEGREFICRIAGDGPLKPELEALIAELGLEEEVILLGSIFQEEMIAQYDWSQALLLPSLSEGTPMTIIEAMAKGRAVVASRITGIPEMIEEGVTGYLISPGSPESLAEALAPLAAEPGICRELGLAGRVRAEELFDLEANSGTLMDVFSQQVPALHLGRPKRVREVW